MKAKPYNPLEKVLAERKAKAGGADFDASVADATMLSQSALNVENTDACPKCNGRMASASLAGDIPALFCADCAVTLPVPEKG